ncbi:MAG TPA: hypothetical protein VFU11_05235 [Solirubrobacterales bacterium]|nr:hypothetical protein [Solirubrobacterales bacterium]
MLTHWRLQDVITLRRSLAVLLLGGFAEAILPALDGLLAFGWRLSGSAPFEAFLLAGISLIAQGGFIYLVLRGAASVIDRWRR